MSDFLRPALQALAPYVPGEQPQGRAFVKLNTNENPYPPSPRVMAALDRAEVATLNLYSDPEAVSLRAALAAANGVEPQWVFTGNGSDEVLGFAFLAFAQPGRPVVMPRVTYGLYPIHAALLGAQALRIPMAADDRIAVAPFLGCGAMVALANPNAPTGLALPLADIEAIAASNPDHVVLVDEAYIAFGGESALPLLPRYPNLLIVRTFSKSHALAGARLGYALGDPALIADLDRVRNAFHPYSINRLSMKAGVAALSDEAYLRETVSRVLATRRRVTAALRAMGFTVPDSQTNFLFVTPPGLSGQKYYLALKARGVLVRHFAEPGLAGRVRVSIGTDEQMDALLSATAAILAGDAAE